MTACNLTELFNFFPPHEFLDNGDSATKYRFPSSEIVIAVSSLALCFDQDVGFGIFGEEGTYLTECVPPPSEVF